MVLWEGIPPAIQPSRRAGGPNTGSLHPEGSLLCHRAVSWFGLCSTRGGPLPPGSLNQRASINHHHHMHPCVHHSATITSICDETKICYPHRNCGWPDITKTLTNKRVLPSIDISSQSASTPHRCGSHGRRAPEMGAAPSSQTILQSPRGETWLAVYLGNFEACLFDARATATPTAVHVLTSGGAVALHARAP